MKNEPEMRPQACLGLTHPSALILLQGAPIRHPSSTPSARSGDHVIILVWN